MFLERVLGKGRKRQKKASCNLLAIAWYIKFQQYPTLTVEVEKHLLKEQINYIESASWCAVPLSAVACTARKIPFMYSFSGNCAASVPISHSCVCEQFIYSQDRSTYFLQQNRQTDPGNIKISHRYMSVGTGRQNIKIMFWK
jgi:hypothetical protein